MNRLLAKNCSLLRFFAKPRNSVRRFAIDVDPELQRIHNKLPKNYKSFAGQMTIDQPMFKYDWVMRKPTDPNLKPEDIPAWSYRQNFIYHPKGIYLAEYRGWQFLSTVLWGWIVWRTYWGGYNIFLGEPEFYVGPNLEDFTDEELGIPNDDEMPLRIYH